MISKISARTLCAVAVLAFSLCIASNPARAEGPYFKVVRKAVVYDGSASSSPGIVKAQNGDLLVSFGANQDSYIIRSQNNGKTWEKPRLVVMGAGTEIGITGLPNGTILWPIMQQLVKMPCCEVRRFTTYVYRSNDNGATWHGDVPIHVQMREPIPYGHILQLPGGKLLMPVWGAYRRGERWQVGTFQSTDGGKTWGHYQQIAYDPEAGCRPDNGFNETSIAQLPDHTLVAILREQRVGTRDHTPAAGPCGHYTEPADHFYRSVSHDLGKTWSHPQRLALIGTSPSLFVLPDGTLVLGDRDHPQFKGDTRHYGLGVRVSHDQGRTWTSEVELQDPKGLHYSKKMQPGYPDFVSLPNGDLLVVFYSLEIHNGKVRHYIAENVLRRIH